jgi:hypothetical protein
MVSAAEIIVQPTDSDERRRRIRGRNIALGLVLLGLVVLFYVVAIVRMTGG